MLFYNTLHRLSLRGGRSSRRSNLLLIREIASPLAMAWLAMTIILTACLPINSTPSTATPPPTDAPPQTPTIVWFPPSATPTLQLFPTNTATPEMNPGIRSQIFSDDFSDASLWDTAVSDQASAIISRNRITLSVQPGIFVSSLRRDITLTNFYAEISARPSLCRADDNYGIIIRSTGNSFYRFVLSCSGFVHVERIKSGTRLIIYNPVPSGDAPPGAPGEVRIGLWAVGSEMRLFLNGRFQFSVAEKTFPSGAFGVFANAKGDTPVTVTFSDLRVYDVDYVLPTRTPSP